MPMLKEMIFHLPRPTILCIRLVRPKRCWLGIRIQAVYCVQLAGSSNKVRRDEGSLEFEAAELDIVV